MIDFDKLIYLDLEFISRKHEEYTGLDPEQKITKSDKASAGIKAVFASAGVSTTESRSYSITSRQMLDKVWEKLEINYNDIEDFENYKGTRIGWIKGTVTIAEWRNKDGSEKGYEYYQLNHEGENTAFLTNEDYFSAGFSKILSASSALKGNIKIPVRCLARYFWHVDDAKNYVACPYVIVETAGNT